MIDPGGRRYRPPVATYRLQLHSGFTLDDAAKWAPYFDRLGISHLYLSPIYTAAPASPHGYDVFDHNQVNPELGGLGALYRLSNALTERDMGLILDIVPNHVGVAGGANPWWRDVLRYGRSSQYANHFDIDWEPQPQMTPGVLVFPILGQPFGVTLESGELTLGLVGDDLAVRYFEHTFPLRPESYAGVVGLPPVTIGRDLRNPASLADLASALEDLSSGVMTRATGGLSRFVGLIASEPAIRQFVEGRLQTFNGQPGNPASFDRLEALLSSQHYRLADWRVAASELNYRRFFDNNSLAAIRVEREEVFDETHRLLLELVAQGIVTGVRVDHIDGLYAPGAYLQRLCEKLRAVAPDSAHGVIPIYVEKILEGDEHLPDWPVEGTTGYDFLASAGGLFVDPSADGPLSAAYDQFVGGRQRLQRARYEARRFVAESAFGGEISVLAYQLYRIGQGQRRHRDNTLRSIRDALVTVLSCFPVYRTYGTAADGAGREDILHAVREAQGRDGALSAGALRLLREALLEPGSGDEAAARDHFRRRFQQVSGPIMAKGVEDTTFFRYNRLLCLNEVGCDPGRFASSPERVHADFRRRLNSHPHAMLATSTHDTKRSEDVRARLAVLTEMPEAWRKEVASWTRLNQRHVQQVDGDPAPDANAQYYLYQTLVGTWEGAVTETYRERIRDHTLKAIREAKLRTSWIAPNDPYEAASLGFVDAILDTRTSRPFLRRLDSFVATILPAARSNSLTILALKVLAPGFPDFYQGCESHSLRLTDPDNRRPVDFESHAGMLESLSANHPGEGGERRLKLWYTEQLLRIRSEHDAWLPCASYEPVHATGRFADHLFGFRRVHGHNEIVVVVPRLVRGLLGAGGSLAEADWADTSIPLEGSYRDLLGGARYTGTIPATQLFASTAVAVLSRQ